MAEDKGDKTEAPTPRRRQEAIEQGNIARSVDLTAAMLLVGITILLSLSGARIIEALRKLVESGLSGQMTLQGARDLAPLMIGPRFQRPGPSGVVDVYPLAIPDGEGLTVPVKFLGEIGFYNLRGALLLVEHTVRSKNDYTFLAFEDPKPAGTEAVALRSGNVSGETWAHMELRDDRVVFFLSELTQGSLKLSYRLRAELPGAFSAMPTRGFAMYAPEIKANSDEMKLKIGE